MALLCLMVGGLQFVAAPSAEAADGPYNFPNSAIADRAEGYANGAYGGQCLVFVANMIRAAGGPAFSFGFNTATYQAQWAQRAASVSIAEVQRGDIVQWGGGAGGSQLHTAIITTGGSSPQVIDSNYGFTERVGRGSFSSRNSPGSVYRIWRVGHGAASSGGNASPNILGAGSFEYDAGGWGTIGAGTNFAHYNNGAVAHDGGFYLATNTPTPGGGLFKDLPVPAGTSYVVSAWVRSEGGTASGQFCGWSLWADAEAFCTPYTVDASTWKHVQVVVNPRHGGNGTVRVQIYATPNGGTTLLDTASVAG